MNHPINYHDFNKLKLEQILFIDIETVAKAAAFDELTGSAQKRWQKKAASLIAFQNKYAALRNALNPVPQPTASAQAIRDYLARNAIVPPNVAEALYLTEAGIHSEFAKIVCISVGYLTPEESSSSNNAAATYKFLAKSFYGDNEKTILTQFHKLLERKSTFYLCAHNGFNFDYPFICRRSIIHALTLPPALQLLQKKPWNTYWLLDTMELWKFMGTKNYASLELIAQTLEFPSPKTTGTAESVDGSMIHELYYHKRAMQNIYEYCEQDCLAVAQIVLRLRGEAIVSPSAFHSKTQTQTPAAAQNSSP